ncbi:MAG: hypothetical protein OEO19_08695 [Gammaproteobacteria bacterium]|nr:hypothetical protein [Gammaproteobacteria bacterium]MDH3447714.1 hypothetical protein [Gammaproteobacteria bacterium]
MRQLFEALRQHHACAGYRVIGNDNLSEGNADPHLGPDLVIDPLIVFRLLRLERQRSRHGVGGAIKFGQERIATQFAHLTVIPGNCLCETLKRILDPPVRLLLIALHQQGRPYDIRVQDHGKFAG